MGKRLKAVESAVVAFSSNQTARPGVGGFSPSDVCRLYNQKRCRFVDCKFRHACKRCGAPHPVLDCQIPPKPFEQSNRLGPIRRARGSSAGDPY